MSDRFLALKTFVRVARLGSFSRAARELGLSQPSASRIVSALEREVGAALMLRTTRAVTLTEAGTDYLARVEPLLAALDDADHAARGTDELRGTLRVGLSSSFAVREVIPRLPPFMARHPALRVDLAVDDQHQNLVVEGVDVALRFGALADSNATARLLDASPRLLVASPAYLRRAGTPQKPADLAAHSVIVGPTGDAPGAWSFEEQGRWTSVRIDGRLAVSSNEGAVSAALAGMGIVSTVVWGCRSDLENGNLVHVLADWNTELVELHAVFPAGRAAKAAARIFADHLAHALGKKRTVRRAPERPTPKGAGLRSRGRRGRAAA
jgi:DNA-binding transcriptional LysR family regulator